MNGFAVAGYAATHVPHPWDAVGSPPPLGHPYQIIEDDADGAKYVEDAIAAARLLQQASDDEAEADRYQESAANLEAEAKPLLAKLPKALADAIRDDPWAIDDGADVAKALA